MVGARKKTRYRQTAAPKGTGAHARDREAAGNGQAPPAEIVDSSVDQNPAMDKRIVRLVELVNKFGAGDNRDTSLRNLYNFLSAEFPKELLTLMHRFSEWDGSDLAKFLYARAALSKDQVKLAHKIISPLVGREGATDQQMLLAARVNLRLRESKAAQELLDRIPRNSALYRETEQLRARINSNNG